MQSELANTMANILDDQQRVVEKDLLSFRLTDVMPLRVFKRLRILD